MKQMSGAAELIFGTHTEAKKTVPYRVFGKPQGFDPRAVKQYVQQGRVRRLANVMPYFWLRVATAASLGAMIILLFTAL